MNFLILTPQPLSLSLANVSFFHLADVIPLEAIQQADRIVILGTADKQVLNQFTGKIVFRGEIAEFLADPQHLLAQASDESDIFLGERDAVMLTPEEVTLGKCAVKKNAHRMSFIVICLVLLAFIFYSFI